MYGPVTIAKLFQHGRLCSLLSGSGVEYWGKIRLESTDQRCTISCREGRKNCFFVALVSWFPETDLLVICVVLGEPELSLEDGCESPMSNLCKSFPRFLLMWSGMTSRQGVPERLCVDLHSGLRLLSEPLGAAA